MSFAGTPNTVQTTISCLVLAAAALVAAGPAVASGPAEPMPTAAAAEAGNTWTQWRGPARDGRFLGPTWPERLGDGRLERLWRVGDLGPSYAGPIVTADRVFSVETRGEADEFVRAFDRQTGRLLWETSWKGAMKVPFFAARNGSWVRSTPAFDGERLYVAGMCDVLVCLDGDSGETVWTVDFKDRFSTPVPSFGFVCSPLVTDEHVFVQAAGSLVKLDKRTGATVWRTLDDGGGMDSAFSSPTVATIHGRPQLLVQTRVRLCAVNPDTGELLWERPIKAFRGMNILTPAPVGDAVFTAPYGGRAQLLRVGRSEASFSAEQAWDNRVQGYMTSPVIIAGHAYFFTRSNRFVCLDLATGEEAWISGPTGDSYWSLVAQGDRILALSDTGRLRLIKASPAAYEVVDEAPVSEDQTWAHLAVAGQEIFIREQTGLVAYRWR
ncbi:MAG: PQQ-binding-like beta-propeller repeat protein [Planctomycetota bacterium]|jgi:outer membrane protein assembly factor BamB